MIRKCHAASLMVRLGDKVSIGDNARVILTNTTGKRAFAVSNGFGTYRFGNLTVGQTYTVSSASKHLVFVPLTVSIAVQSVDLDLIAGQ